MNNYVQNPLYEFMKKIQPKIRYTESFTQFLVKVQYENFIPVAKKWFTTKPLLNKTKKILPCAQVKNLFRFGKTPIFLECRDASVTVQFPTSTGEPVPTLHWCTSKKNQLMVPLIE
jgi:hypothetical protein